MFTIESHLIPWKLIRKWKCTSSSVFNALKQLIQHPTCVPDQHKLTLQSLFTHFCPPISLRSLTLDYSDYALLITVYYRLLHLAIFLPFWLSPLFRHTWRGWYATVVQYGGFLCKWHIAFCSSPKMIHSLLIDIKFPP